MLSRGIPTNELEQKHESFHSDFADLYYTADRPSAVTASASVAPLSESLRDLRTLAISPGVRRLSFQSA
ncbi:hypothetical protein ACLIBH_10030 [Virgibacillus sp. W0430]|uniref:hypothetical protein n=1 Tax=Virgibacillus sp. W0430 TaxID=3391580 RepID=UPI003F46F072